MPRLCFTNVYVFVDLSGTLNPASIEGENVTLNFHASLMDHHARKIQLKYRYHDGENDVAILEIKDIHLHTEFPEPLLLWWHSMSRLNELKFTIIGFGNNKNPTDKHSETCQIIQDFSARYQEALASLYQNAGEYKEDLRNQRKDECLVDGGYGGIENHNFIKFDSFMGPGISGGPVITQEANSPKAIAVFIGGMPRFFYEMTEGKQTSFEKRYLFEIGLKMTKIREILINKDPVLASEIFPSH